MVVLFRRLNVWYRGCPSFEVEKKIDVQNNPLENVHTKGKVIRTLKKIQKSAVRNDWPHIKSLLIEHFKIACYSASTGVPFFVADYYRDQFQPISKVGKITKLNVQRYTVPKHGQELWSDRRNFCYPMPCYKTTLVYG